jgi:hypothetical protein
MFTRKGRSGMLTIFISLIGSFLLSLAIPQTMFGLVLYDDFSSLTINAGKWQEYEYAREIQSGQLRLKLRSTVNTTGPVENGLLFQNPSSINAVEAKVTPLSYINPQGAQRSIFIGGRFFNDGTGSPGTYTGDILAQVNIVGGSGASPVAMWAVIRFTDPYDTSQYVVIDYGFFALTPALGTQYTLSTAWDGKQFTFGISDGSTNEEATSVPGLTVTPANMPEKFLYQRISNNAGREVTLEALFDDVKINGSPDVYDDFSGSTIDPTKWSTYEAVRDVDSGALRLKKRTSTEDTGPVSTISLDFANPEFIKTMQAQVTPLVYSNPNGLDTKVNISGRYYNDGTNNGYQGDVIAGVGIGGTGASPVASWTLRRHTDPTDSSLTELVDTGDFSTTITLGTPYTLFVSWDGAGFIFKVNDEVATYNPATSIHPPNYPMRRLQARVLSPGGQETLIEAAYDDVMIETGAYQGTYGTQITLGGPGFGSKKGKVFISGLKQKVDSWSDASITVFVNKYKGLVTDTPYDVSIQPKEPKGASPIDFPGAFILRKPEIDPINTATGSIGDPITVNGMWFGTKKGKVYLGDQKCKVTDWRMEDPATGVSKLTFIVHKKLGAGTYFLEVENKIGRSLSFGFEVK